MTEQATPLAPQDFIDMWRFVNSVGNVVVTGGTGFIGANFVRSLPEAFAPITVLAKRTGVSTAKALEDLVFEDQVRLDDLDLSNYSRLCQQLSKAQYVFHFAAQSHVARSIEDPEPFIHANVVGTMNLLHACMDMEVPKIILISSCEVYGDAQGEQREDGGLLPKSPYAASKAGADLLAQSFIHTYGAPIVIVRPCNNFGPWQHEEKVIPRFIKQALAGEDLTVHGDGAQKREWIYVEDCCQAIAHAADLPAGVYNIGSGEIRSVTEIAREILLEHIPESKSRITQTSDRPGQVREFHLSREKFESATGWRPKTSFSDGLRRTVAWYRNQ